MMYLEIRTDLLTFRTPFHLCVVMIRCNVEIRKDGEISDNDVYFP